MLTVNCKTPSFDNLTKAISFRARAVYSKFAGNAKAKVNAVASG